MRLDKEGMDNGTVSIDTASSEIVVGRKYRMTVTYTAGPQGLAAGGCLRFRLPGFKVDEYPRGVPVRCSNPRVALTSTNAVPEVNGKPGYEFFATPYLFVTVGGAALGPGDTISVDYGHNIGARYIAAPRCAQRWAVEVAVDVDGLRGAPHSGFWLAPDPPVLDFVADRAVELEVTIPSSTVLGERFDSVVRARDHYKNIVPGYTGTVTLQGRAYTFTPEDAGVHRFEDTVFDTPGVHRIEVMDEGLGAYARSNATKTRLEPPARRLYWGDTHTHSTVSADTAASNSFRPRPAGDYDYARNRSDLDFCMVTDHSQDLTDEDWDETRRAAADWDEPGRFVTFSAFEATHQPLRRDGDKNVHFFGDDQDYVAEGTTAEMYAELRRRPGGVMVIPHQHARTNWALHDPELERVVEVYAHWGCGLSPEAEPPMIAPLPPENCVSHALECGCKLGFIASADHSWGHPGDDFWWPLSNYNGGLAAVCAPELTREGIWQGLWDRRCYGTTRARILLEFEVDGHAMGEEFVADGPGCNLAANVYGTSAIEQVEIVKNGRVVKSFPGDGGPDLELTWTDKEPEKQTDYYYVHVLQADGEQAWSSPVWVSRPGEPPPSATSQCRVEPNRAKTASAADDADGADALRNTTRYG